jgi:hypothetical protein
VRALSPCQSLSPLSLLSPMYSHVTYGHSKQCMSFKCDGEQNNRMRKNMYLPDSKRAINKE